MAALAALAGVSTLVGGAYADGKLQISPDLRGAWRVKQGERNYDRAVKCEFSPCFELFRANALKLARHEAIWTRTRSYTWEVALQMVCRYASFFESLGIGPGDFVAFYLTNSPDFMFCWMALLALGAAPALVNYNLGAEAFVRCVEVANARLVLVDDNAQCKNRAEKARDQFDRQGIKMLVLNESLRELVEGLSPAQPSRPDAEANSSIGLMYTSGSTGLPKAMKVGMQRAYCTASVEQKTFGQRPGPNGDRTYHCMPLYHGTGGLAALIDMMGGLSIAIAPRFSTTHFWKDCIDSRSTIFVYVGEIIRYLLAAPPSVNDRRHSIRLVWGNGLRPDVWTSFQSRFRVPEVGEFFASTEGMLTLVNYSRNDLSVGAVGHHGWLNRHKTRGMYVSVRMDGATGDIFRDRKTGFAEKTPFAQGGEILVRVPDRSAWSGYLGAEEATNLKFLSDVFEPGDLYYRTGDALRRDRDGYWYFLDRLGDTYRWKGENVSTTEVSEVLGSHPMVREANVYGVTVPGHEGRAGCAATRLHRQESRLSWKESVATHLRSKLPSYAVPVFVRLLDESVAMTTGNHKYIKGPLQREGVDPDLRGIHVKGGQGDRVFWLKPGSSSFTEFTSRDWLNLKKEKVGQESEGPKL